MKQNNSVTSVHKALEARARELAAMTPSTKGGKTPRKCACDPWCGGMTKGGTWMPGHDAKMLSKMVAAIRSKAVDDALAAMKAEEAKKLARVKADTKRIVDLLDTPEGDSK